MRTLLTILLIAAGAAPLAAADGPYDTIVVCPPPLVEAMRPWFAHRVAQGRKIGVITECDSPEQIRAGIRAAAGPGKLTHVLIVGSDHPARAADGKLRSITVPAARIEAKVNVRFGSEPQIATDNWYADLTDNHVPDVAIGRLAARSPEQLAVMVGKIIDYENSIDHGMWRRRINFIAGVGGFGAVTDVILDMATRKFITTEIPAGFQTSMTYASLASPFCPDPRRLPEAALARHNEGCLFWVYIGHGHRRWLDSMQVDERAFPILSVDHVRAMHAAAGAPIAVFLACYAGAFDERESCLSEEMLAWPGGPVAVISGTRVTMPYANAVLGQALLEHCFARDHTTLGEVLLHAKRSAGGGEAAGANRKLLDALAAAFSPNKGELEDERAEHLHMYNLLGDPLLRLRRPQEIELTASGTASAGEEVVIEGDSPISGRLTVELVCRRDRLTFEPPSRRGFRLTDESARHLAETYVRANDQCWTTQQMDVAGGPFRTTLKVPSAAGGHGHVRVYVEGENGFALGAADIYVQRAAEREEAN